MNTRDKAIVADLERFRCMTRDDIAALHFSHVKNPVSQTNVVLKRLRRDGVIDCATDRRMYVYFPVPSIKKDSAKLGHFLAIVEFYREICAIEKPRIFEVEPKVGEKGFPEPDVFMIWRGAPWYVEVQRSQFSARVMGEKFQRYSAYHLDGRWADESWQPPGKKFFPNVWITGVGRYSVPDGIPYRVYQETVEGMHAKISAQMASQASTTPQQNPPQQQTPAPTPRTPTRTTAPPASFPSAPTIGTASIRR